MEQHFEQSSMAAETNQRATHRHAFSGDHQLLRIMEQTVIPQLFAKKQADQTVRVWFAGCGTGELVYAIAILFLQYSWQQPNPPEVEIFATDSDEQAVMQARRGKMSEAQLAAYSPAQIKRFFTTTEDGYSARREVRNLIIFANHRPVSDPPFIRIDLIVCPRLFNDLWPNNHEYVLRLFQYSLQHGGLLLLGQEALPEGITSLFTPLDGDEQLFGCIPVPNFIPRATPDPILTYSRAGLASSSNPSVDQQDALVYERYLHHLAAFAPTSVLVNEWYDIVHLSRYDERLLQIPSGTAIVNLLNIVPPDLQHPLRSALFTVAQTGRSVSVPDLQVQLGGEQHTVRLYVQPLYDAPAERRYTLIFFQDDLQPGRTPSLPGIRYMKPQGHDPNTAPESGSGELADAIQHYEGALHTQQVTNEELQAVNEELLVLTEELKTSQEEMTALNEELTAVNEELRFKIEEAIHAHSDLQNLMSATEIGILFTDRQLRITRFTPHVVGLFNVIPADLYRPLAHISHSLDYATLVDDAESVIVTLEPVERETQRNDGRWYLVRMRPYRTLDHRINGVVLTFVDITERKQTENELRHTPRRA